MSAEQTMKVKREGRKRREARYWAIVLIWAGLVFGAESIGALPKIGSADAWNWVFFGAGLVALLGAMLRAASPNRPEPTASLWDFVWGAILIILGLSGLTTLKIGFPLILLLIGIALLSTNLLHADRSLE